MNKNIPSQHREKNQERECRELILDTETTGFSPPSDRVVSVGLVELINLMPTGREYEFFINPQRSMPQSAQRVHGLSEEFLSDKPVFKDIALQLLNIIGEARLVIHNAAFDMNFLYAEFKQAGFQPEDVLPAMGSTRVIDTVALARKVIKPQLRSVSLDRLCEHYGISLNSRRDHHGALVDCRLLAKVYQELCGGKQRYLEMLNDQAKQHNNASKLVSNRSTSPTQDGDSLQNNTDRKILSTWIHDERPIVKVASDDESTQHDDMMKRLGLLKDSSQQQNSPTQ